MIKVCAMMHRNGMYFDDRVAQVVAKRYHNKYNQELADLHSMVQDLIDDKDTPNNRKRPFATGKDFNPTSPKHVQYLCYSLLQLPNVEGSTGKEVLRDFGLPQTDKVLAVRSLSVLINSFVDKLRVVASGYDGRVHAQFKSVGADTGRMSSNSPNLQNIPSHATDIRHMFRATPEVDENVEVQGNSITLKYYDRVETADGFVPCGKLKASDTLYLTDDSDQTHIVAVQNVDIDNDNVTVTWQ